MDKQASIFVSIASYRDTECPPTLADMFAKADYPERVVAGVLWQLVANEDEDCALIPPGVPISQIRGLRADASHSMGPCWARSRIQRELYRAEDFYLQIDSHMRFTPGWDSRLIRMFHRCSNSRAVLSTYPATYLPPDELGPPVVPVLEAKCFDDNGILHLRGRPLDLERLPSKPLANALVAAGFLFGPGRLVADVPYDPWIYFHGEEIALAARLWTHGYDLYSPDEHLIHHDYSTDRARPRHWSDHRDWTALNQRSVQRVRHLLRSSSCEDAMTLRDIEHYGLGEQRTLAQYETFSDISFGDVRIGSRAARAEFSAPAEAGGMPPSDGANPGGLLALAKALRTVCRETAIRSLLDMDAQRSGLHASLLSGANPQALSIHTAPAILQGEQPVARELACHDAVLCHRIFESMSNSEIQFTLQRIRDSGARFLLAGTWLPGEYRDAEPRRPRAISLLHRQFGLGRPVRQIVDSSAAGFDAGIGQRRVLGLWDLQATGKKKA